MEYEFRLFHSELIWGCNEPTMIKVLHLGFPCFSISLGMPVKFADFQTSFTHVDQRGFGMEHANHACYFASAFFLGPTGQLRLLFRWPVCGGGGGGLLPCTNLRRKSAIKMRKGEDLASAVIKDIPGPNQGSDAPWCLGWLLHFTGRVVCDLPRRQLIRLTALPHNC